MIRLVLMIGLMLGVAAGAPVPAVALTEAASRLVTQELETACGDKPARYDPAYVVERDLDGDGVADLVVAQEGIECGKASRSAVCGEMVCPIAVWLRRGDQFTPALDAASGYDLTIGSDPIPEIRWVTENGAPAAVRWDGSGFR